MIDGGRCPGREEMYVFHFTDYAKSLGCTVEWFDYMNKWQLNGYTFAGDIHGNDYSSPDYFAAIISFNGKRIAKIEYDGQDRLEPYASIFDRERFHIIFYEMVIPFTKMEKLKYKLKNLFSKKETFYYHPPCTTGDYLLPNYYNINKTQKDESPMLKNFLNDEQVKEKIKYMVFDNQRLLKEHKIHNKLNEIEEDFK